MASLDLSAEEFAGLLAIDGSLMQHRPPIDVEIRLRALGLIERNSLSRLPIRTKHGNDLVRARTSD